MEVDIYCDESYPDVFSSKNSPVDYLAIGSLWLSQKKREHFKLLKHKLFDNTGTQIDSTYNMIRQSPKWE